MKTLVGTEKQIKWAATIREDMLKGFDVFEVADNENMKIARKQIEETEDAKWFIENRELAFYSDRQEKTWLDFEHEIFSHMGRRERKAVVRSVIE